MSQFSKEYCDYINIFCESDFSFLEEFDFLKEGEVHSEICEGLGVVGIKRENGQPVLIFSDNREENYFDFFHKVVEVIHF